MIHIECSWCDTDLVLDSHEATSLDCPECRTTVEIAPDSEALALAA
jgi:Zn finger protein HypA/HybF involved in hydrogenase expression